MKKKAILALVSTACVLVFIGCNSPAGPSTGDENTAQDITITLDGTYTLGSTEDYPGAEINLSEYNLADISKYESVTVKATLCDADGNTITPGGASASGLGQFTLLKAGGSWADSNKVTATHYNMLVDGDNTYYVAPTDTGVPKALLVQTDASKTPMVSVIKVQTVTFKARTAETSDVVLKVVFGGDSKITVERNKITFIDAMYSDCAALYEFPEDWLPLSGKQITVSFKLENFDTTKEHQIHIQAANGLNDYNGDNPDGGNGNKGQLYITMDDPEKDWNAETASGSFVIDGTKLEEAAGAKSFTLTGMRFVNNGTIWTNEGVTHDRDKSYSLIINSIKITG